jgi:hypothetical protein
MATKRASTGRNEVGMMSDLKEVAEAVGKEVLGFEIEWVVETTAAKIGKRPDVEIRRQDGNRELIISGEAKRPETPEGIHAFVASEVQGAIAKAKSLNGAYAFTTNFLSIAVFDATHHGEDDYLDALVGSEAIEWVDEKESFTEGWWASLTKERRTALVTPGLERFFQQVRKLRAEDEARPAINKDEVYLSIFKQSTDALVSASVPALIDAFSALTLPGSVLDEAKHRDFDLSKPDVVRYFVAQSVAEILTSGLFYQTVRPLFGLKPMLGGTRPTTSKLLVEVLNKNLAEATKVTGDYETIFGLSEGAKWVLGIDSAPIRTQWINLFESLSAVKFEEVTSDIIGVIFERLISAERRQDMGQHYTQSRLAKAMTQWAVTQPDDLVVDFSAGGGTFLVEAYAKLREDRTHEQVLQQVFGNDLDSFAVHLSTVNLATRDIFKGHNFPAVSNRDGFDIRPGDAAVDVTPQSGDNYRLNFPARFNVVLGNPPYDEKSDQPDKYRAALAELAGDGGVSILPKGLKDDINLAAWFLLLAGVWLAPNGRIALVLPASILQNEKHAPVLNWLRSKYDISVWHTESDVWFSDARVAPITLFMKPRGEKSADYGTFTFVNVTEPVSGEVVDGDGFPLPLGAFVSRDLSKFPADQDALIEGTRPDALRAFESASKVVSLGNYSGVSIFRGNKLGHALYKLKDRDPKSTGVVRSLEGFDIQLKLDSKYLTPLLKSPKDEPTGEFDNSKVNWWILNAPAQLPSGGGLEKYIKAVKRAGAHEAPSVKAKGANWWNVNWKTSRIAIAAHPQFQHQMWWGQTPFVATDNMQALGFDAQTSAEGQELVAASLASGFGALSALYRSNEVGCEGVRWLSSQNLEGWFVLNPAQVEKERVKPLLDAYRAFRKLKTSKVFEMPQATKAAWRSLTVEVARAAGLADPEAAADAALQEAHSTTLRRREREILANSGRTRSGSTGGGKLLRDIKSFTETAPVFREVVDMLSNGDATVKIKTKESTETPLFDLDGEAERQTIGNLLARELGEGFEAAPLWEQDVVDKVVELYNTVRNHFVEPDADGNIPKGFEQVRTIIADSVTKSLQTAVKKRLS